MIKKLFCIALLTGSYHSTLDASAPSPNDKNSHEWFLNEIKSKSDAKVAEILSFYEAHLRENPEDVQAHIEQCKFLERSREAEDWEFGGDDERVEASLAALLEKFPNEPQVVLYRASRLFGEEKATYLQGHLRVNGGRWPDAALAEMFEALAWHYYHHGQLDRAATAGQRAMTFDATRDLSLVVAAYCETTGRRENALAVLRSKRDAPGEGWVIERKAQLLCDLGAFQDALSVFQLLEAQHKGAADNLRYAKALQECGQFELARQKLAEAKTSIMDQEAVCRAIFLFDLEHSDGPTALSSYNALRDLGFRTDPLLRYRVGLAIKHPAAEWAVRDIAGFVAILVVVMAIAAAPALLIFPLHYVGLVRRQFRTFEPTRPLHWNLRHFWAISAIYVFAASLIVVIFDYADLISACFSQFSSGAIDLQEYLAKSHLAFFLILAVGTSLLLRRKHWGLLVSSRWPLLKTLFYAGVLVVFLRMIARVLVGWPFDSLDDANFFGTAVLGFGTESPSSEITQIFLAIYRDYGAGVLLVIAVMVIPFYEELIFRGIILDSCERHLSFHCANVLQAVAFSLLHQSLVLIPFFVLFGLVAGLLRRESGGLLAPILMHMGNNFLAVLKLSAITLSLPLFSGW